MVTWSSGVKTKRPDYFPRQQCGEYVCGQVFRLAPDGPQVNFRLLGYLVGSIDPSKVFDVSGLGLGIEPFRVAPHAFLDRRVDEYLDEFVRRRPGARTMSRSAR